MKPPTLPAIAGANAFLAGTNNKAPEFHQTDTLEDAERNLAVCITNPVAAENVK